MGAVFALGAFASLPVPRPGQDARTVILTLALWLALGGFAWTVWNRPKLTWPMWGTALLLSFVAFKKFATPWPFAVLALWGAWFRLRSSREARLPALAFLALALGAPAFAATPAKAKAKALPAKKVSEDATKPSSGASDALMPAPGGPALPKYLLGYKLGELASCSAIEKIPWKFARDRRKTRLLMRDTLRLSTEFQPATWEVNQVMDGDGYVSYVFSKVRDGHRVESLVVKDNVFNRIVDRGGESKVTEVQDLRTLINRPVITLNHTDGSLISFSPGLAGQSLLTIELKHPEGRPLPPVFVRGMYCDRPQGDNDAPDGTQTTPGKKPATGGSGGTGFGGGLTL